MSYPDYPPRPEPARSGGTFKRVLIALIVIFVAVLAVIIGQRMSTDAMAVVIGVVFGVAASIPTSLLIVAVTRRAQQHEARYNDREAAPPYPPVIVVNPGGPQPHLPPWQQSGYIPPSLPLLDAQTGRQYRVVGSEGELDADEVPGGGGWTVS